MDAMGFGIDVSEGKHRLVSLEPFDQEIRLLQGIGVLYEHSVYIMKLCVDQRLKYVTVNAMVVDRV